MAGMKILAWHYQQLDLEKDLEKYQPDPQHNQLSHLNLKYHVHKEKEGPPNVLAKD